MNAQRIRRNHRMQLEHERSVNRTYTILISVTSFLLGIAFTTPVW